MKILYIIGQLGRGGAEQQFYYLLKYLHPDACVISLRPGGYWAQPIRELGIEVIELERRGRADFSRLFQIIRTIRRSPPDIIHLFNDHPYGLYGRLAALLTGHHCLIVSVRAHPTSDPAWYIQLQRLWLNRNVRCVIANSRAARDYLVNQMALSPAKAHFIPNGIEIERIQREAESRAALPSGFDHARIVGTVGGLSPVKNPRLFLEVANKVLPRYPAARFLWVGGGTLRSEVEALRDEFGLRDKVVFVGEQIDVPRWLAAA